MKLNPDRRAALLATIFLAGIVSAQAAENPPSTLSAFLRQGNTAVAFLASASADTAKTAAPSGLPTAEEIDGVLRELSAVTGFRIRRQLPFELITREQVNKYLKEQIKDSVKPDEIRPEEVTLKKLGFAPPDFDLKQTTIDLLTEQAAAFYDFHRKKLFISDWATVNMRDTALIHELAR